jgi:hypothetical protein
MLDGDVLQSHQSGKNASEWINKQKSKKNFFGNHKQKSSDRISAKRPK